MMKHDREDRDVSRYGIRIRTLNLNPPQIEVLVRTDRRGQVSLTIEKPGCEEPVLTTAGPARDGKALFTLDIPDGRIWSCETPEIYRCKVVTRIEKMETTFGIRMLDWSASEGLTINGEHVALTGTGCRFPDVDTEEERLQELLEKQVRQLREKGFNALYVTEGSHPEILMDICDRMGMLLVKEFAGGWKQEEDSASPVRVSEYHWKKGLLELTDGSMNHPSLVIYALGADTANLSDDADAVLVGEMADFLHNWDGTRPVFIHMKPNMITNKNAARFFEKADITGLGTDLRKSLRDLKKNPERLLLATDLPVHNAFDLLKSMDINKQVLGGFFTAGEHDPGAFTRVCLGREEGPYLSVRPVLPYTKVETDTDQSVGIESWSWRGGAKKLEIEVFAYGDYADLVLNGVSQGRKALVAGRAVYSVPFVPGVLKALSFDKKNSLISSKTLQTAARTTILTAHAEEEAVEAGRPLDVIVRYTDPEGIWKPMIRQILTLEAENAVFVIEKTAPETEDTNDSAEAEATESAAPETAGTDVTAEAEAAEDTASETEDTDITAEAETVEDTASETGDTDVSAEAEAAEDAVPETEDTGVSAETEAEATGTEEVDSNEEELVSEKDNELTVKTLHGEAVVTLFPDGTGPVRLCIRDHDQLYEMEIPLRYTSYT